MTTIPNPSLGDTFLNEVTGVTYEYDGEKWIVIKTPGSEEAEQISEDLTDLTLGLQMVRLLKGKSRKLLLMPL